MEPRAQKHKFLYKGLEEYYWTFGDNKNPPLLILHGFTGTHSDLIHVAEILEKKYYIYMLDLPGWGKSEELPGDLTIKSYSRFVKEFLNQKKLGKLSIFGYCMGSAIAIDFASLFPEQVKELFLLSTPYIKGTLPEIFFKHLADISALSPRIIKRLFFLWRARIFTIPFGLYAVKFKTFSKKLRFIIKTSDRSFENEELIESYWNDLINYNYDKIKKIKVPIHMIHGGSDVIIPPSQAKKLHALIPTATLDFIPAAGHMPNLETPESLGNMILKYSS